MQAMSRAQRRPVQALCTGHIEVGLVDRSHLDERREVPQHLMNAAGIFAIALGMPVYKNGLWAELGGGAQRHGGVHSEFSRRIRRRRNHPTLITLPADYHWLALQRRVVKFLHRHEERIHV